MAEFLESNGGSGFPQCSLNFSATFSDFSRNFLFHHIKMLSFSEIDSIGNELMIIEHRRSWH